ncbi:MAG: hypothetical protein IJQ39_04560 [Thermoguttaceae bacterium]|nr:hypothetical protein [Thermoguttaceae bacterium]
MKQFTCKECGKVVTLKLGERIRKFCSARCQNRHQQREYYKRHRGQRGIVPIACKHCGKEFTPPYGDKRYKYCCKTCQLEHNRLTYQQKKNYGATEKKFCVMCGKSFETHTGAEFCSRFCRNWHKRYTAAKNKKLIYNRFMTELDKRKESQ